jgi:hypothetical protein
MRVAVCFGSALDCASAFYSPLNPGLIALSTPFGHARPDGFRSSDAPTAPHEDNPTSRRASVSRLFGAVAPAYENGAVPGGGKLSARLVGGV